MVTLPNIEDHILPNINLPKIQKELEIGLESLLSENQDIKEEFDLVLKGERFQTEYSGLQFIYGIILTVTFCPCKIKYKSRKKEDSMV